MPTAALFLLTNHVNFLVYVNVFGGNGNAVILSCTQVTTANSQTPKMPPKINSGISQCQPRKNIIANWQL